MFQLALQQIVTTSQAGKKSITWWQWQFPVLLLSGCGFMSLLSQDHTFSFGVWVSSSKPEQKQTYCLTFFFFTSWEINIFIEIVVFKFKFSRDSSVSLGEFWKSPFTVIQHQLYKIGSLWCHKDFCWAHCILSQVNGNSSSRVLGSEYMHCLPATPVLIQTCQSYNSRISKHVQALYKGKMCFMLLKVKSFFYFNWALNGCSTGIRFEK